MRGKVSGTTQRRESGLSAVTANEGSLLALVLRRQPVTAYQLFRIYELSPVTSFNASKGSLYPMIARLKAAGLLEGQRIKGDARRSESLRCTPAGRDAVKTWVMDLRPGHVALDDPLRTKLLSFDCLSEEEQLAWVQRALALVAERTVLVERYATLVTVPFQEHAHQSALDALDTKRRWLEKLLDALGPG